MQRQQNLFLLKCRSHSTYFGMTMHQLLMPDSHYRANPTCMLTRMPVCTPVSKHASLHVCMHSCMLASKLSCMHTDCSRAAREHEHALPETYAYRLCASIGANISFY